MGGGLCGRRWGQAQENQHTNKKQQSKQNEEEIHQGALTACHSPRVFSGEQMQSLVAAEFSISSRDPILIHNDFQMLSSFGGGRESEGTLPWNVPDQNITAHTQMTRRIARRTTAADFQSVIMCNLLALTTKPTMWAAVFPADWCQCSQMPCQWCQGIQIISKAIYTKKALSQAFETWRIL